MKNYLIAIMLVLAMPLSFASAYATIAFDRTTVNVSQGQVFQVLVSVDPHAEKNYTVKLALDYPADTLQVTSFAFSSGWTQLNQPGYDLVDNGKGSLIKTAGYPGGFNGPKAFGTVTFKATKSGNATVKVSSDSLVLDGNNTNQLSGAASFSVVASSSAPVAVNPTAPAQTAPNAVQKPSTPASNETGVAIAQPQPTEKSEEQPIQTPEVASEGSTASLFESITIGRVGMILALLVLVLGVIFYVANSVRE